MAEQIISLVFGKRGSGKSYLVKTRFIKERSRVIIYDALGEYEDGIVFYSKADLCRFWLDHYKQNFRIIYRPADLEDIAEFDELCRLVFWCGNCTFVCEEVDNYADSRRGIAPAFKQIVNRGRHKDIEVIAVTQRPRGLSVNVRANCKEVYIFNSNEPADRDFFADWLGVEILEHMTACGQYQFVKWIDGAGYEIDKA